LVLRANQPYIFKVIEGCKRCAELHAISNPIQMKIDAEKNRDKPDPDKFEPVEEDDDIYTVEDFLAYVKEGSFIDDDGFGDLSDGVNKLKGYSEWVYPSSIEESLEKHPWATHVVWYNK
jgi:hypothetical protein